MMPSKHAVWITLLMAALLIGCDDAVSVLDQITSSGTGTLKGTVTIGPLCPIEPCDLTADQIAEIYRARVIFVYDKTTEAEVERVRLDADGGYSLQLETGSYIVDVSDGAGQPLPLNPGERPIIGNIVPQTATIRPNETTVLDIDVDTGIR